MLAEYQDKDKSFWLKKLQLRPHPDGGYFTENYRSIDKVDGQSNNMSNHHASTSIYHLYDSEAKSFCHQLNADEMWYYHYGSSITIYVIDEQGNVSVKNVAQVKQKIWPCWFLKTHSLVQEYLNLTHMD